MKNVMIFFLIVAVLTAGPAELQNSVLMTCLMLTLLKLNTVKK